MKTGPGLTMNEINKTIERSIFMLRVKERHPITSDSIEDCANDGGEEIFTKMHCVQITNL